MQKFKIGEVEGKDLSIDINELINSRMVVQGSSGSGKSGVVRVLCERISKHIPFLLFDPEGEYATLREVVDLILVGPRGDMPTDMRAVELLMRKLVEMRVSAVIDMSELKLPAKREYMARAAVALVDLPKALWLPEAVIIDEAQIFAPEKSSGQKDTVSTLPVTDLVSRGRKRGFAVIPVTQRFAKLHNDVLAETKNVFIGSTWLDADQKKAGDYLGLVGNDRRALRDMPTRTFYCFGPAVSIKGVSQVYIDTAESTFPKAGQIDKIQLPKASDAIGHILEQMDDLPEAAEIEKKDIASLRTENADLKKQLAERPTVPEPVTEFVDKDVPVLPDDFTKKALELADTISQKIATFSHDLGIQVAEIEQTADVIRGAVETATGQLVIEKGTVGHMRQHFGIPEPPINRPQQPTTTPVVERSAPAPSKAPRRPVTEIKQHDGDLTTLQQTILDGIALLDSIGHRNPTIPQVCAVIAKGANAGPVRGAFTHLAGYGYIDLDPNTAIVSITDVGRALAVIPNITSRADIHNLWYQRLKGNELEFLRILINAHPHWLSFTELGEKIGKNVNAGPIRGSLNALIDKGLAESDGDGMRASDVFFPEGLN